MLAKLLPLVPAVLVGVVLGLIIGEMYTHTALLEDIYISVQEQRRIAIAAVERELARAAAESAEHKDN